MSRRGGSRSRRIGAHRSRNERTTKCCRSAGEHVTLEVEGIDRMYLNVYVPGLQREQGVACFFRFHRGHQFASSALMDPISKTFVRLLRRLRRQEIPVIPFRKGQRKDDVAAEQRKKFGRRKGWCSSAKHRRRHRCFAPSGGAVKDRWHLSVAGALHRHGESVLLLLRGPRLWPVLPEVLHVLPLQRQAVPQRTRIRSNDN